MERDGKFLIRQRPEGIVNAHLWEFPNVEINRETTPARAFENLLRRKPVAVEKFCTIKHSITRYRITLEVWRAELPRNSPGRSPALQGVWHTLALCESLAFTSAHKKIRSKLKLTADRK